MRLSPQEITSVCDAYRGGASLIDLARQFSVDRNTVAHHLTRQGVELRWKGLTPEEVQTAAHLYGCGWSLAGVAEQLDCSSSTIWRALRKLSYPMRNNHGV
jgi:DNA-binding NarL/FixJ family response regulator